MRVTHMLAVGIALMVATPARAAELKLEFRAGRVNLTARDVSVRQILAEWARVGGTQILNMDRVSASPVTLQLEGVSERQALEVILRSVAGYLAAPRRSDHPGSSVYDRILVMAVSNPPPASAIRPGLPQGFPTPRGIGTPTATPPLFPPMLTDDDQNDTGDDVNLVTRPGLMIPASPGAPTPPAGGGVNTPSAGTSVPGIVAPVPQPPNQPPGAPVGR
jgi:hypothetical protein